MTTFRQWVGWVSWLLVAIHGYMFAWLHFDRDLAFALPADVVLRLCDLMDVYSAEGVMDVYVWSTSIAFVGMLHVAAVSVAVCLRRCFPAAMAWPLVYQCMAPKVGWTCWILVSAFALSVLADEVTMRSGGKLTSDEGMLFAGYAATVVGVAALHWVVLRAMRGRRC